MTCGTCSRSHDAGAAGVPFPEALYPPREQMISRVGVVVPAWYAPDLPVEAAAGLLRTTLEGSAGCIRPADVAVVVDGCEVALAAAQAVREELAPRWRAPFLLVELPRNLGKGAALAAGFRALLER